jgi:thiol-disulfide isomerase/thioredoxin
MALTMTFAVLTATALGGELEPVPDPRPHPGLSLPDLSGSHHRLSDYRGRVVLLNFWATWCPPCLLEMPGIQRLTDQLRGRPFAVLAVNAGESRHKIHKALRISGFNETVLLDPGRKVTADWRVQVFPTSYLLDRGGRVRYQAQGPLEWDSDEVVAVLETLLSDQAEKASRATSTGGS